MLYSKNSPFLWLFLANIIFVLHFLLIVIVSLGWLWNGFYFYHFGLLLATLASELFFGYCLLTRLEFGIRKKIDPNLLFDKSCIVHYIRKWRGLAPRPPVLASVSFWKKNSFLFIVCIIGSIGFVFNFYLRNVFEV